MLEKEFKYYINHQNELVKKYKDKYLVIVGKQVIDALDSYAEAYDSAIEKYEKGTFLIQHCIPGKESYTHVFHSRVAI